jgi:hypothetical protein
VSNGCIFLFGAIWREDATAMPVVRKPACSRRRTATLTPMYGSFLTWMSYRCHGDALTPHLDRRQRIGVLSEDVRRSTLPDHASDQTGIRIHLPRQVNVDSQCQAQHGVASRTCSSCPSISLTAFGSAILGDVFICHLHLVTPRLEYQCHAGCEVAIVCN